MDQAEFDEVMLRLVGVYHQQETSQPLRAEMHRVLAPYPAAAIERAVDAHIERSAYFPKPSELLELVDKGPLVMRAPCGACDGTGWIDTAPPDVDDAGNAAASAEAGWATKCQVCQGSGGGKGW